MQQLGPYEILARVGTGAQGAVFKARAPDGREVAVKLLLGRTAEDLARFRREARLLEDLAQEGGIVPILDSGLAPEGPYVVMPFLGGGTLREKLVFGAQPVEKVLALARDLCDAVGRCHARGVVHRDLKPENILFHSAAHGGVDPRDRPFVADLGLAKHFRTDVAGASRSQALSKTGELRGTAGYSAPEQFRDAKAVGPEADVFALGAIFYECLLGTPAFMGDSAIEVMTRIEDGERPPSLVLPDVPRAFCRAIDRALAIDPKKRPADAVALLDEIETGEEPRRFSSLPVGLGAGLLAVGLAVALVAWRAGAGPPISSPVPRPSASASLTPLRSPSPSPSPARADAEVEATLARGRGLFARGAFAQALGEAESVVERAPADARGYELRGHVRLALLEYSTAARDFARAVELDDKLASAWAGRAWALGARIATTSSESVSCARRALELAPGAAETWIARSFARTVADPPAAIEDARHAVALDGSDAQTHAALANALGNSGDWRSALPEIEAALALSPEDPHALLLRGISSGWLDDRNPLSAEADADRVLARAPRSHLALRMRGRYRGQRGDHKGAVADLRQAVSVEPDDVRGWRELGLALEHVNKVEAEKVLTHALALAPDDGPSFHYRGHVRLLKGDFEGAATDLARACESDPGDWNVWHSRGQAALSRDRFAEAVPYLERAVGLSPTSPEPWIDLGRARLGLKQDGPAALAFDRALGLAPDHPHALMGRALLRHDQGDDAGARLDLEKVIAALPPTDQDGRVARALLRQIRGAAETKIHSRDGSR